MSAALILLKLISLTYCDFSIFSKIRYRAGIKNFKIIVSKTQVGYQK